MLAREQMMLGEIYIAIFYKTKYKRIHPQSSKPLEKDTAPAGQKIRLRKVKENDANFNTAPVS